MQDAIIDARNVTKCFGRFKALANVDFTARRGEKVIICGPSGSGKSTLIRCLNGLEQHDLGTIEVLGIKVDAQRKDIFKLRRRVGMVFQQFNLFPHLTILENCTLALRMQGIPQAEADEIALRFLARVRIADQAAKYPGRLSGGQQQRAAIARTLCLSPEILLFDEPTSALDPEMVKEVLDVMEELAAAGITMICVTHEMGFARKVADRVIFMAEGGIVEEGPPAALFSAPSTPRLQDFLANVVH